MQYACRKTLADSRPRVRGRFAKNDDFGEAPRASGGHHDEDDEEDVRSDLLPVWDTKCGMQPINFFSLLYFPKQMGMKGEDELVDSSDILAHISGVNSFKCTFPIQSWIWSLPFCKMKHFNKFCRLLFLPGFRDLGLIKLK